MTSTNTAAAINRLPQVANMVLTYTGDLAVYKWVSLVDSTLNNNNPCLDGSVAAVAADTTHSGAQQAASGTRDVTIPQGAGDLLDETKTYAVCYAETDGATSDTTWDDSFIRLQISLVESISSHLVTHTTYGQVATVGGSEIGWDGTDYLTKAVTNLNLGYSGTLADNTWVSLVDSTLNNNFPCDDTRAGAEAGTTHSGPILAAGNNLNLDARGMDKSKSYFVCYCVSQGGGDAGPGKLDVFVHSGIILTMSKVQFITFGSPVRTMTSTNTAAAVNRLPQVANMVLTSQAVLLHTSGYR